MPYTRVIAVLVALALLAACNDSRQANAESSASGSKAASSATSSRASTTRADQDRRNDSRLNGSRSGIGASSPGSVVTTGRVPAERMNQYPRDDFQRNESRSGLRASNSASSENSGPVIYFVDEDGNVDGSFEVVRGLDEQIRFLEEYLAKNSTLLDTQQVRQSLQILEVLKEQKAAADAHREKQSSSNAVTP